MALRCCNTAIGGVTVTVGTLSKVLAPGLRTGFVVGPRALMERMAALRAVMDRQGDHPMEATIADTLEDGELMRHIRRTRNVYRARRDALVDALQQQLSDVVDVSAPRGGIALWAKVKSAAAPHITGAALCLRPLHRGRASCWRRRRRRRLRRFSSPVDVAPISMT